MSTVSQRVKEKGVCPSQYINLKDFDIITLEDENCLKKENISPATVGMVVEYMARFMLCKNKEKAFEVSLKGAKEKYNIGDKSAISTAKRYITNIKGLDSVSIKNACKLVSYDVWYRNPVSAILSDDSQNPIPDENTIQNIKIMVKRSLSFWEKYGPVVSIGFDFKGGGYTSTVSAGDGDFLTEDTLWDFKVSSKNPSAKNLLQILMYYIMGKHSGQKIYDEIQKIGIYNPRLNKVYLLDVSKLDPQTIKKIEKDVICYKTFDKNNFDLRIILIPFFCILIVLLFCFSHSI